MLICLATTYITQSFSNKPTKFSGRKGAIRYINLKDMLTPWHDGRKDEKVWGENSRSLLASSKKFKIVYSEFTVLGVCT